MEKTLGPLWPEHIRRDAGPKDTEAVTQHGHRNHKNRKGCTHPGAALCQISIGDRQRDQRHERADPAASFHNLQRVIGKDQQIAFAQNGQQDTMNGLDEIDRIHLRTKQRPEQHVSGGAEARLW